MPLAGEKDEPFHPLEICLLGPVSPVDPTASNHAPSSEDRIRIRYSWFRDKSRVYGFFASERRLKVVPFRTDLYLFSTLKPMGAEFAL